MTRQRVGPGDDGPEDARPPPAGRRILRVGLTGNIAAGKSKVVERLAGLGCHVLDADVIARACLAPGEPAHREVVETFGEEILDDGGGVDRARLGAVVFADPGARRRLEEILHPRIREREAELVERWSGGVERGIVVTEAALLFETGSASRYDRMVVVVAPDGVRLERLRDGGMSEDDARRRMAAQMDQHEKARRADYVLVNDSTRARLRAQAEELYRRLQADLSALEAGRRLPDVDVELRR